MKRAGKNPCQRCIQGPYSGLWSVVGGAGPREAGGPHGPRHRQRVGSQGGMPTRSSPEAGLAGDEYLKLISLPPDFAHHDPSHNRVSTHDCATGLMFKPFVRDYLQVAQDAVEDAAVLEVADLVRGVEPDDGLELARLLDPLARRRRRRTDGSPRRSRGRRARSTSSPSRPSDCAVSPSGSCSGSTPIPIRFERWMRSKLSAITARTPSSAVPFAAQSRDEPEPYSLPASTTSGTPSSA